MHLALVPDHCDRLNPTLTVGARGKQRQLQSAVTITASDSVQDILKTTKDEDR